MNQLKNAVIAAIASLLLSTSVFADESELASGGWVKKSYSIDGGWKIIQRDDQRLIVFDDEFKTKKGPDLKVYLSKLPIDSIRDSEVEGSSIKISPLISNKGSQEFMIPDNVDLSEYSSVLVHCEAYSHLWGGGELKQE